MSQHPATDFKETLTSEAKAPFEDLLGSSDRPQGSPETKPTISDPNHEESSSMNSDPDGRAPCEDDCDTMKPARHYDNEHRPAEHPLMVENDETVDRTDHTSSSALFTGEENPYAPGTNDPPLIRPASVFLSHGPSCVLK